MIASNDQIILIGNIDFHFIIIKEIKFYTTNEFNPFIADLDIIKLVDTNNINNAICSDYEFKNENKIQIIKFEEKSNDICQNWIINIQK